MSSLPLHVYQQKAIQHIQTHSRCAIFASMGSGKTRICLEAITQFPVLVVAPLRVAKSVWPDEVNKWKPDKKCVVINGSPQKRLEILNSQADIYTINFENLMWLEKTGLASKFETIIVDESSKLRGFRIQRGTKNIAALRRLDKAKQFIELTGTPAPQGIVDLYGQLHFLDNGHRLGRTWQAFTSRFFNSVLMPGGYTKLTPYPKSFNLVTNLIKDICLTIDVKDYMDIDEPIKTVVPVELPEKVMAKYKEFEKEMVLELEKNVVTAMTAAALTNKCLQITSGFVYNEGKDPLKVHEEKLLALDDILEEWSHRPIIVVYWFKESLKLLQSRYPQGKVLTDPKDWNAAGLDRAVHLYFLTAKNTIDEKVLKVLDGKATIQSTLLENLK